MRQPIRLAFIFSFFDINTEIVRKIFRFGVVRDFLLLYNGIDC